MKCLSQMIESLSYALEQLGLYEPEISVLEARNRLELEGEIWRKSQIDRNELWNAFQANSITTAPLCSLVEKAITHLESRDITKGVAVDLGCGINSTTFNLLDKGWKVYAVDSSDLVIKTLAEKVSSMGKNWIENKQLVLIHESIEKFKYPEKVHLIIATDSLPYCDPNKICEIFHEAKNALLPNGVLVCNLFPYSDKFMANEMLRGIFGGWMTTKNVVNAVMRTVDFASWTVTDGMSPTGLMKQFHIIAMVDSLL